MTKLLNGRIRELKARIKELIEMSKTMRTGAAIFLEEAESADNKIRELWEEIKELRAQK